MLVVLTLIPPCPANAGRPEALAARAPRTRASAPREPAKLAALRKFAKKKKLEFHAISAVTGEGVDELKYAMAKAVRQLPRDTATEHKPRRRRVS